MAVKIVRFINGDELIGDMKFESDSVKISKPLQLMIVPAPGGQPGQGMLGMAPFMPYSSSKEFSFNPDSILTMADPVDQVLAEYTKNTSGIVLAKTL